MHIVVCLNQIPDPEAPAKQFRLSEETGQPALDRMNRVLGPFDENALELAIQLKDSSGAKVTALTVGPTSNQEVLKRALACRADAAVHVKDESASAMDSATIAKVLAAAITRLGQVDLVMFGRQGGDWDRAQVGLLVAEELGINCQHLVREIELLTNGGIKVIREVPGGTVIVQDELPIVATVTNSVTNQLRIPKVKDVMVANRTPIALWTIGELGFSPDDPGGTLARVRVLQVAVPETASMVQMVEGSNDDEKAEALAKLILGLKVL